MLDHGAHAWPEFRGARLFITGAGGFVGSWLLESLLHADRAHRLGIRVTALVRDPARFSGRLPHLAAAPAVTLQHGDVKQEIAPSEEFTHIVHCASAASPEENAASPNDVVDLIEVGTSHVLDLAREHSGTRFLQMSSGSVYGSQPPAMEKMPESHAGEADPTVPVERFGAAKRAAERFGASAAGDGVHFVVARAFGLVGPRLPLDGQFAIGNFLRDAMAGRPVAVHGDGTPVRSWLYAADLAAWCWTVLARGEAGTSYNVGSDQAVSIGQAALRVASLAKPPLPVTIARTVTSTPQASRFVPNIARAREKLGLDVWIPLDDAIGRTWDWVRQ